MKKIYNPPALDVWQLNTQETITTGEPMDLVSTMEGIEEW